MFLLFIIFTFGILNGASLATGSSHSADLEYARDATIIVGSIRFRGDVPNPIYDAVCQEEADFSHTKSFPDSKVISVDMRPCMRELPHIKGDFLTLPFLDNSIKRIFFEWFPSHCRGSSIPPSTPYCDYEPVYRNYQPLLLFSLRKAYKILKPGGELLIDHIPYSIRLPSDCDEALEVLSANGVSPKIIKKIKKKLPENYINCPGSVSKVWQEYDPFTISMSYREYEEILNFLRNGTAPLSSSPTNLVAINNSIKRLAIIFKKKPKSIKKNLIKDLESELKGAISSGSLKMFRWVYGMKSRDSTMLNALHTIGFEVDMNVIPCFNINPYTKRHFAWIIEARKPAG